jgi:mannose-1-phosphate guanylyltransferase
MICHMFDRLLEAGIQRFIVNTYHLADAFPAAFPTGEWRGAPIIFARENVRLETGGGLKNIEPLLDDDDHALLVCNGDVFATPDFPALAAAHAAAGTAAPDVTLLLRSTGTPLNVRLRADGVVTDMRHRLGTTDADGSLRLFTGIYCASRSFFNALVAGCAESVVEAFLRRIADAAGSVRGFVDDASDWHDLGSLDEYAAICKRFN